MQVADVAKKLAVTPETVRYYTREGLLKPATDKTNGYRHYSNTDSDRLRFIVNARQLGFSVADIKAILAKADSGETPCPKVRELIEQRLQETEARFREIKALRGRMKKAIAQWDRQPDSLPCGHSICGLIESLEEA